jgi:fumarate reductase (CoM/CoB) subunit A
VFADRAIGRIAEYVQSHERVPAFDDLASEFGAWSAQFEVDSSYTAREVFGAVRDMLWLDANVVREHDSLCRSLARLDVLQAGYNPLVHGFDAWHALTVAKVLMLTMLGRTESRGAHYRADFPNMDACAYRQIVSVKEGAIHLARA